MGAEDYLAKPFDRVLLRARIGATLKKKWLRDRESRKTRELEQTLQLLERAQAQLALQASQDALTGLANRYCVNAHLEKRTKGTRPFSVVYIDLNGFKKIRRRPGGGSSTAALVLSCPGFYTRQSRFGDNVNVKVYVRSHNVTEATCTTYCCG